MNNKKILLFIRFACDWIVEYVGSLPPVKWALGFWDHTVGPVLERAVEMVKSVINTIIGQIVNVLVTPVLSADLLNATHKIRSPSK